MIKNEKQYKIAQKKLQSILDKLAEMQDNQPLPAKDRLILASLTDLKIQMESEVAIYESIRTHIGGYFPERAIEALPDIIIEYKIRMGLTQKQFAQKIGMKEQQLQRYEADNFRSISFQNLLKLLHAVGLEITIKGNLIENPPAPETVEG